ncbi:hypothetical protein HELRODRAFT_177760 [Helobdella robusta]|uniref:WSC domain-containing protein n=1 Tax=Helobdella robusta TaxID=6412 RepID=T1FC75_HELRO|nr:hypothetical protein HELRODRAFT_177760 [Helobdella robusta]ESN97702.1 hypothetical protein HELRODRAFT_177760 [Helobdella robusta]
MVTLANYIGCYAGTRLIESQTTESFLACSIHCLHKPFFGFQGKQSCVCVHVLGTKVSPSKCNVTCFDGKACGGKSHISVYGNEKCPASIILKIEVRGCRENNGGCGEQICFEAGPDNGEGAEIRCYPPDENFFMSSEVVVERNMNYKGCFAKMHSSKELKIESVNSCLEYCKETFFYGMKNSDTCSCAKTVEHEVSAERCNKLCSDGFSCGGSSFYSVYASKTSIIITIFQNLKDHII